MKKTLLVMSDIHGSVANLRAALTWAGSFAPDAAVFLGDGISELERTRATMGFPYPWHMVRGNNDFDPLQPEAAVFEFGGHRFFICHGHHYSIYSGKDVLVAAARNNQAGAALFGHTHIPFVDDADGVLLVNPGSIGNPRSRVGPSFAVIECRPGSPPKPEFWGIGFDGRVSAIFVGNSL
ncbi:MAG: metallophosphoesterase [Treponema sp.]|nr:metallophosphoesterase [Treponema sp.]